MKVQRWKRTPLTEEEGESLIRAQDWDVPFEIPDHIWLSTPGIQRIDDTVACMGSVSLSHPRMLNGLPGVAGFISWCVNRTGSPVSQREMPTTSYSRKAAARPTTIHTSSMGRSAPNRGCPIILNRTT